MKSYDVMFLQEVLEELDNMLDYIYRKDKNVDLDKLVDKLFVSKFKEDLDKGSPKYLGCSGTDFYGYFMSELEYKYDITDNNTLNLDYAKKLVKLVSLISWDRCMTSKEVLSEYNKKDIQLFMTLHNGEINKEEILKVFYVFVTSGISKTVGGTWLDKKRTKVSTTSLRDAKY